ncbi:MAG: hypothetical protein ABSC29_01680 [Minisyncoccia bacterium]|jgi:hypothetical protein
MPFETPRNQEEENRLMAEMSAIVSRAYGNEAIRKEAYRLLMAHLANIETKYPDHRNYRMYHEALGSTAEEGDCSEFDFPGEDSIVLFINEQIKPLVEKV